MNKIVSMDDIIVLIKEQLSQDGCVTFTPKGRSMLPLLRNNLDTVTLKKPQFPLKKYQIVLYIRESGKYVLHRVVKVNKDSYVMRGDNQFISETGIRDEQIIGVVDSFTRKNKTYSSQSLSVKIYSRIWINTTTIRKGYKITRRLAGKIKRKMIG